MLGECSSPFLPREASHNWGVCFSLFASWLLKSSLRDLTSWIFGSLSMARLASIIWNMSVLKVNKLLSIVGAMMENKMEVPQKTKNRITTR